MICERFVCGRSRSNTYLVAPSAPGPALVVDAGPGVARRIGDRASSLELGVEAVLLTHAHPDHVWDLRTICTEHGVPAYVHPDDLPWLDDPTSGGTIPVLRTAGRIFARLRPLRSTDLQELDGERFDAAGAEIRVLHTPGHTPGGVCFVLGDLCFTGDTVFAGGVGHTGYPSAHRPTLRRSIRGRLLGLPDHLRLLPGHGPETTLGRAREFLEDFAGS